MKPKSKAYKPSRKEIAEQCEAIQAEWTEQERERRRGRRGRRDEEYGTVEIQVCRIEGIE